VKGFHEASADGRAARLRFPWHIGDTFHFVMQGFAVNRRKAGLGAKAFNVRRFRIQRRWPVPCSSQRETTSSASLRRRQQAAKHAGGRG